MIREEFFASMAEHRSGVAITPTELCFKIKMMHSDLRRLETGKHNSSISLIFEYLIAIESYLKLMDGRKTFKCMSSDDVIYSFVEIRKRHDLTQRDLAPIINVSKTTVTNIEAKNNKLTIDVFLRFCNALNISIEFVKKESV